MTADEIFKTADIRCRQVGAGALVLSLEQARPTITADVLDALERAVAEAERRSMPLVVTGPGKHFAFGANLDAALVAAAAGDTQPLAAALERYQQVMLRLRHALIPTVAAVRGVAISGACELLMHVTRVVAHPESYIGLAEPALGLVPGGGGLKEFARRAGQAGDPGPQIEHALRTVAAATVARSASQAQQLGFLTQADRVDAADPLAEAIELAIALQAAGYAAPPSDSTFPGGGAELLEKLRCAQSELVAEGEITKHQFEINARLAQVLCGVAQPGALRTEAEVLALERQHLVALAQMPLSQARRAHYLNTGKVLRN